MDSKLKRHVANMDTVRYQGKWYKIVRRPYEPERQTMQVAWAQIREPEIMPIEHYRKYFEKQRKEARILYPSFRKDDS